MALLDAQHLLQHLCLLLHLPLRPALLLVPLLGLCDHHIRLGSAPALLRNHAVRAAHMLAVVAPAAAPQVLRDPPRGLVACLPAPREGLGLLRAPEEVLQLWVSCSGASKLSVEQACMHALRAALAAACTQ